MQPLLVRLLSMDLPVIPGKEPPGEFRIIPAGRYETTKGVFVYDEESARLIIEAAKRRNRKFSGDYEHRALTAELSPTGEAPASCWYDLEARPDGLWAVNVQWTEKASAYLRSGEYRYFSPAFRHTKDGHIQDFINLALTNLPASHGMQPLAACEVLPPPPPETAPMKTVLNALMLSETASEADALSVVTKLKEENAGLLSLLGATSVSEAKGAVVALKADAAKVAALSEELAVVHQEAARVELETLLTEGVKTGKIPPGEKPFFEEMGKKDLSMLKGYLKQATPKVADKALAPAGDGSTTVTLTAEEVRMAKALNPGVDEKVLAAHKQAMLAEGRLG
jgi:phage I-like protein